MVSLSTLIDRRAVFVRASEKRSRPIETTVVVAVARN
jgi:hypothetical protein